MEVYELINPLNLLHKILDVYILHLAPNKIALALLLFFYFTS